MYVSITSLFPSCQGTEDLLRKKTEHVAWESQQAEKIIATRISNQAPECWYWQKHWPHGALIKLDLYSDSYGQSLYMCRPWGKKAKPVVRPLCSGEHFNVVNTYQRCSDKMSHQVVMRKISLNLTPEGCTLPPRYSLTKQSLLSICCKHDDKMLAAGSKWKQQT